MRRLPEFACVDVSEPISGNSIAALCNDCKSANAAHGLCPGCSRDEGFMCEFFDVKKN